MESKKKSFLLVLTLFVLVVGISIFYYVTKAQNRTVDTEEIYNRFIKTPVDILNVQEPIELISSHIFADGGTISFSFRDATQKEFHIKLPTQFSLKESETINDLCYQFNGRQLTNRGKEEQALCGLLMRWAKQYPEFWLLLNVNENPYKNWSAHIHSLTGDEYYKNRGLIFTYVLIQRQTN